jgi:hypothetical protein
MTWALLTIWLVWEVRLLVIGLWSFRGPQTGTVNGLIHHGHMDRVETLVAAMISGFPSGLYVPALIVDPLAKKLGIGLFGARDTVVEFIFSWLIICLCGFVQWCLVLRGLESVVKRMKMNRRSESLPVR